jgi:ElaB/YqjD/DUF883 family membrane-anchored ribosome-binding protein
VSSDPDALRELVDRKAEDLKHDLEELGQRVVAEPKALVEEKVASVRKALTFVRTHPVLTSLAAGALGFAVGFLV